MIARAAGGLDSWGAGSVLDLTPNELHRRTGFYVGVSEGVRVIESYFREDKQDG